MHTKIEVVRGSHNIFRDLGLPNAELEQARVDLAAEIIKVLTQRKWTVRKAEKESGVDASDFSRIRNCDLKRFTVDRLMKILTKLQHRVELKVKPVRQRGGETSIQAL